MRVVFSGFVVAVLTVFQATNSLKVSVYYEALCPDSVRFIASQLYPHFSEIAKYVELDLVPYGKAAHSGLNGTYNFLCQHGPSECRGNKYQSCALSLKSGSETEVNFVNCVMRSRAPSSLNTIEFCARKFSMDVPKIKACSDSDEGDKLLAANGDRTPSIAFVPTVIYDDVFDQTAQDQSMEDFLAVVCSKITNDTKPSLCNGRRLPKVTNWMLYDI